MPRPIIRLYVCEKCGKEGRDMDEMRRHERTPLSGLDLKVGDIFGIKSEKYDSHVIVVEDVSPLESHQLEYDGLLYRIPPQIPNQPFVTYESFFSADFLAELSDEDYLRAKETIERDGLAARRGVTQFSKGIIKRMPEVGVK